MESNPVADSLPGSSLLDIPLYEIDEQTLRSLDPYYRSIAEILIIDGYWRKRA